MRLNLLRDWNKADASMRDIPLSVFFEGRTVKRSTVETVSRTVQNERNNSNVSDISISGLTV